MDATVLTTFFDRKTGKRFEAGDVVSISANNFDRITSQGKFLKKGRHPFGNGTCHPCNKKTKNK